VLYFVSSELFRDRLRPTFSRFCSSLSAARVDLLGAAKAHFAKTDRIDLHLPESSLLQHHTWIAFTSVSIVQTARSFRLRRSIFSSSRQHHLCASATNGRRSTPSAQIAPSGRDVNEPSYHAIKQGAELSGNTKSSSGRLTEASIAPHEPRGSPAACGSVRS